MANRLGELSGGRTDCIRAVKFSGEVAAKRFGTGLLYVVSRGTNNFGRIRFTDYVLTAVNGRGDTVTVLNTLTDPERDLDGTLIGRFDAADDPRVSARHAEVMGSLVSIKDPDALVFGPYVQTD